MTAPHTTGTRPHGEVASTDATGRRTSALGAGTARGASVAQTGAVPLVVAVTAVVVTRGRTPFLPATLAALAAQDRGPDEVVVVDVGASESTSRHDDLRLGGSRFVPAPGARSLGEAVDLAVDAVGVPESGWLWILHDDSAPEPGALARLLRAVEHSSAVAIAGSKQRRWEVDEDGQPCPAASGTLVEVGHTVSPLGRRMTGIDDTEIDQGQHDGREDVLAVGLAGALVRGAVWVDLGGTDPELGAFGDGLDLCRRARLAGHRVVVVPGAVVRHAQGTLRGLRSRSAPTAPTVPTAMDTETSRYARRRSQLYLRLVEAPLPLLPVLWLLMLAWAPFAAMYRLALTRPAHARDELVAAVVTAARVVPLYRARRRAARTRRLPRRVLVPLRGTWRDVAAERRDARLTRAELHRHRWAPTQLERAELRRVGRARRGALALVVLVVVALDVLLFGPWQGVLADGGRVVGGALLPAPGTLGDVWQAATSGWVRDGLGTAAPADPLLLPLTALTALVGGGAQTAVNVLVVTALPLAALAGWFAAGALTRSVGVRVVAAVAWVAAPGFLASLDTGRLGAVLVHLVLPWLLVAGVRAVGAQARDAVGPPARRRGSLAAAAAAGLLLAVAVCAVPVVMAVAVAVIGLAILLTPRYWRRLLLVLLPSAVLLAPFWGQVVGDWADGGWRLLVAEPGAPVVTQGAPTAMELLLGLPGGTTWFGLDDKSGALGALGTVGPMLLGAGVLVLAAVSLVRRRARRGVRLAWLTAAIGLTTALVAGATAVASGADAAGKSAAVTGWPGVGLSVLLLGLGAAAVRALPAEPTAGWHDEPRSHRVGAAAWVALGVVTLALPAAQLASWTLDADTGGSEAGGAVGALHATGDPVVPAVGQQMQAPPRAARVLQVDRVAPSEDPDGSDIVDYTLLGSDGSRLQDSSTVVLARSAGLLPGGDRRDVALLDDLVADVVVGRAPDVAARLASFGVGAVQMPPGGDPDLVTTLDLVPGLARVTEDGTLVWRVTTDGPAPGWATVVRTAPLAQDGTPSATYAPDDAARTLPADGSSASGRVAEGPDTRTLRIAGSADPGWLATLDGRRLVAADAAGLQAFDLGPGAGTVHVSYESPYRTTWLVGAGLVLLVHLLLALPLGRRRGR